MSSVLAGKTTLLNILQNRPQTNGTVNKSNRVLSKTIPTIGVNHYDIVLNKVKGNKAELSLKEYGGQLAPLWTTYLKQQQPPFSLIYLVDAADISKVSETSVHLIETLEQLTVTKNQIKLLIVYSKTDLLSPDGSDFLGDRPPFDNRRISEYRQLLRVHHLKTFCPNIQVCEVLFSAINCLGLPFILHWLNGL